MKKTFSLLGLMLIGLTLLFSPDVGLLTAATGDAVALPVQPVVTTTSQVVTEDPATTTTESGEPLSDPPPTTSTTVHQTLTVLGPAVNSPYGPFQVQAEITNGELVNIETLQQPGDRRSNAINNQVLPAYEAAALDAQSANIDVISGATVTWRAYTQSLQAALDEAGL